MTIDLNYLRKQKISTGANKEVVKYIDDLFSATSQMYLKQQKDWYINDKFVDGEHWIVYNKTLNRIQTIPIVQGEVRRTINKIRSQIRGVKNFIKRSQPRWEVHPNDVTNEAYVEAGAKNKILQEIYTDTNLKQKLTDVVINGLKYSVGFLEGGMVKKDGEEKIDFWVNSTYDVVPEPSVDIQSCRYIFKTFSKPIEALKNNEDYNTEGLETADNKESASEYKNILELEKYNRDTNRSSKDLETVIVKELWLKWLVGKDVKVRVITIAGNNVLRVYEPKYRRYPVFTYNPEKTCDSIYSNPWIKDLISINKSLDKTVSQVESYIQRMLAGKWLIKKGSDISVITDKGADKIYYSGSTPPIQQSLQPLPSAPLNYITSLETWLEELGGVRAASLGRSVGSIQSGKGIEALQSADAETVAEPIENLEIFLKQVAEFILELISDHVIASESIINGGEKINYIGEVGKTKPEGSIVIGPKNKVTVKIVPEVAYSESEKKEWLMRLAEAQMLDPQTVLEQFNFSNISDIITRMKARAEEKYKEEITKQQASHQSAGSEMPNEDSADYADRENMQMASGKNIPLTPKAIWAPEHTELHIAFIQENKDAYSQNKELFDAHISNEQQYGNQEFGIK